MGLPKDVPVPEVPFRKNVTTTAISPERTFMHDTPSLG